MARLLRRPRQLGIFEDTLPILVIALAGALAGIPSLALAEGYVGEAVCLGCHEALDPEFAAHYGATIHAKVLTEQNALNETMKLGCEACHGPGGAHVAARGGKGVGGLVSFEGTSPEDVAAQNAVCLQCHEGGGRRFWHGSAHDSRDVGCTTCHTLMRKVSDDFQLAKKTQIATCSRCHQIQASRVYRNAHMPLRPGAFNSSTATEGKLTCGSCHNPHGTVTESLIAHTSVNENCLSCHADKRGPFLWEHPPVNENCLNCHDPHGATRDKMLKLGPPRLCQSCHIATAHPSQPRVPDDAFVLGSSCLQCHMNIHGSNHPSGFVFTR